MKATKTLITEEEREVLEAIGDGVVPTTGGRLALNRAIRQPIGGAA